MTYEQQRVRRILLRNTLLFFAVFTLLFSLFGIMVFQLVSDNVYRSADQQLGAVHDVAAATTAPVAISAQDSTALEAGTDAAVSLPSTSLSTAQPDAETARPVYDIGEQYVESNPQII